MGLRHKNLDFRRRNRSAIVRSLDSDTDLDLGRLVGQSHLDELKADIVGSDAAEGGIAGLVEVGTADLVDKENAGQEVGHHIADLHNRPDRTVDRRSLN